VGDIEARDREIGETCVQHAFGAVLAVLLTPDTASGPGERIAFI
jgi:hypothetical protein